MEIKLHVGNNQRTSEEVILDSKHLNAIIVGTPGAGKSTFVNGIIRGLCIDYGQHELELKLIDCRGVEFECFTNSLGLSFIPHVSTLVSSKHPHVLWGSLYMLEAEMRRRMQVFKNHNVSSIEEFNDKCLNIEEPMLPVVVILDEFPVAFSEGMKEETEKFLAYVRAHQARCGVHIIFSTQTPPKYNWDTVLDMCANRIALRCSSNLSKDVLGSAVASELKEKYGYVYTNTEKGMSPLSTTLWQFKTTTDKDIRDVCEEMHEDGFHYVAPLYT